MPKTYPSSLTPPAVGLAVDFQSCFIDRLASAKQRSNFAADGRAFADALYDAGVPTVWTAYQGSMADQFKLHAYGITVDKRRRHGLMDAKLHADEAVLIKRVANSFAATSPLEEHIKDQNVSDVIIQGLNTRICVAETVWGAVKAGLTAHVVTDLLGDDKASASQCDDLTWHEKTVRASLRLIAFHNYAHTQDSALRFSNDFGAQSAWEDKRREAVIELQKQVDNVTTPIEPRWYDQEIAQRLQNVHYTTRAGILDRLRSKNPSPQL